VELEATIGLEREFTTNALPTVIFLVSLATMQISAIHHQRESARIAA
jgi:hypothetical protein